MTTFIVSPAIPGTSTGWTTLDAANSYFLTERLDSSAWDALALLPGGKDGKTAVLNMAYNRLRFCQDFSIPVSPSAAELEYLKYAQLELAYYLALHLTDEDRRKGLQAQGVTQAGIVKESYGSEALNKIPLPPVVVDFMQGFSSAENVFVRDIARDENYRASEDVTEKDGGLL